MGFKWVTSYKFMFFNWALVINWIIKTKIGGRSIWHMAWSWWFYFGFSGWNGVGHPGFWSCLKGRACLCFSNQDFARWWGKHKVHGQSELVSQGKDCDAISAWKWNILTMKWLRHLRTGLLHLRGSTCSCEYKPPLHVGREHHPQVGGETQGSIPRHLGKM